jgi:dephospho-CoA kinase
MINAIGAILTAKLGAFALCWKLYKAALFPSLGMSALKTADSFSRDCVWCPMVVDRIAFAGKKYSGKTETLEIIFELLDGKVDIVSTSETLIELLSSQIGISRSEIKQNKEKYRSKLQALGDSLEKDMPAGVMQEAFERVPAKSFHLVDSVRRASEVWYLNKKRNTLFVLVEADPEIRLIRGGNIDDSHITESEAVTALKAQELSGNPYVITIKNNGTPEELRQQVENKLKGLSIIPTENFNLEPNV